MTTALRLLCGSALAVAAAAAVVLARRDIDVRLDDVEALARRTSREIDSSEARLQAVYQEALDATVGLIPIRRAIGRLEERVDRLTDRAGADRVEG